MANYGLNLSPIIEQIIDPLEVPELLEPAAPYAVKSENWYKTISYGFRIIDIPKNILEAGPIQLKQAESLALGNPTGLAFYFPVNPESINISTPFAVQVTPTLGGVVEEHSGAVFYNITLSGTTGIMPNISIFTGRPLNAKSETRNCAYEPDLKDKMARKIGFGGNTYNAAMGAVAAYKKLMSQLTGIEDDKTVDDDRNENTGYTTFHALYKYLWLYHYDKANGYNKMLQFVNYKDNNQYNVIVQNFQLSRDKSRPHLYTYSIQMKGWLLTTETDQLDSNPAAMAKSALEWATRLSNLGLDEGPSFKATAFRVVNSTKSVLNTGKNLLNTAAQDLAF